MSLGPSELGVLVVVAGVCGVIGGWIAGEKGRGNEGFVLGLLLGPVGILIAAFLRPTPEVEAKRRIAIERAETELRSREENGPTL